MRSLRRLGVYVVLSATITAVYAQNSGGAIGGTVSDPQGAVIASAEIIVDNTGTHETRHVVSSSSGFYTATNLTPGIYDLRVSSPGFSNVLRKDVEVQVGSEIVLNFELKVGAASEQVEVVGTVPEVETASSTLGAVNTGQAVRELPLNGRDWTTLAALQPGVAIVRTENATALTASRGNRGNGTMMAIGGARPQQNNYRLDGVSVNDYAGGGPASVLGVSLGVDAIQEFSVVTGNATADYGKTSGGVVNAMTRAGTNQLHGSAYEFFRNSALDAPNFFDNASGSKIPPFKRNQFGGSAGGPVIHDKTFFFADYEGIRQSLGVTTVDTVLSPDARSGQLVLGKVTVNSKIAPYLALFPLPNAGIKGDTGTYAFAAQDATDENFFTSRIDHTFSEKDHIHGTFLFDNGRTDGPDIFNGVLLGTESHRKTANIEEGHVFSPVAINFVRIGVNRVVAEQVKSESAINPLANDPSLGFMPGRAVGGINIAGLTNYPGGFGAAGDYQFAYTSYQFYDDFSLTKRAHSLKIGGAFERIQSNALGAGTNNGTATFGSISGFLQNLPTAFSATVPGTGVPTGLRQSVFGLYVQDDWRYRRNLTLNLGLRYEPASVPTEEHDRLATLVWGSQQLKIGSPWFQNPTKRNFSPRFGFAWDPFGDGKTSIRAAFGLYDSLPLTSLFSLIAVLSAPYNEQGSSTSVPAGSFPNGLANTLAAGNGLRAAFIEQNPKRNYVEQWNLTVQRQLTRGLMAELGYSGSHGVHSPLIISDINTALPVANTPAGYVWPTPKGSGAKPWANFGNATSVIWQVSSTYDGFRAKLQQRLGHGMQILGAYTFSKSLDTGSTSVQAAFTNSVTNSPYFDSHIRKAPSDFDVRQNVSISGSWEIPGTSLKMLAWATKGWQLGSILTASSGHPFTMIVAGDALGLNSSVPYNYPDRLNSPGCNDPVNPGSPNAYIKLSCFAAPTPATRLGNAGRNVAYGPGLVSWDASLFKNNHITRISETFNVQFRAEMFNTLNHANFSTPLPASSQVYTVNLALIPSAGQLTSTSTTARQMQFAIKVIW
jgi:hypothetical protein